MFLFFIAAETVKEEHKMSYFSQITTPQEELNYLKKVNELNEQLHEKYNNRFFSDHNIQRKYETMFKPITKPLRKSLAQQEQFHKSLSHKEQQQKQQQPQEEGGEPSGTFTTPLQRRKKPFSIPAGKKRKVVSSKKGSLSRKTKRPLFNVNEEGEWEHEGDGGFHIAQFIQRPEQYGFPDKFFGITAKKAGGQYTFLGSTILISGDPSNRMEIVDPVRLRQTLNIPSQNLWEIIVLQTPSRAITHTDSVQYGKILIANDFENWLKNKRDSKSKQRMLQSPKLLNIILPAIRDAKQHTGSGMMYTSRSPRYFLNRMKKQGKGIHGFKKKKNSSVVFFPANKKVLLKKLIYLLGEFQCGNTRALRNEIIPIVNYLKSQKALPAKFDTKRMNWIYD